MYSCLSVCLTLKQEVVGLDDASSLHHQSTIKLDQHVIVAARLTFIAQHTAILDDETTNPHYSN